MRWPDKIRWAGGVRGGLARVRGGPRVVRWIR